MPKIFKENKIALLFANIFIVGLWVSISTLLINKINSNLFNDPLFLSKLGFLFKFIPPLWLTYYLWIIRKGFSK